MSKIVIDTNIWISVLTPRSSFHHILLDLRKKRYDLAVSSEIMLEYEEVVKKKYGNQTGEFFLDLLTILPNVHYIHPTYRWRLITVDPDDNKYIDTAIASGADYIVTEDNHFKVLKSIEFPVVKVLSLEAFSELLKTNSL